MSRKWLYCPKCKKWNYTYILTVNRCYYCGGEIGPLWVTKR